MTRLNDKMNIAKFWIVLVVRIKKTGRIVYKIKIFWKNKGSLLRNPSPFEHPILKTLLLIPFKNKNSFYKAVDFSPQNLSKTDSSWTFLLCICHKHFMKSFFMTRLMKKLSLLNFELFWWSEFKNWQNC